MGTLRELQLALVVKINEVRQRDKLIEELKAELDKKDTWIQALASELDKYRSVLKPLPISRVVSAVHDNHKVKRTAISAEPTNFALCLESSKSKRIRKSYL